jgi:hypothetical protein
MRVMDFDVLPGPSLPERARTTLARAMTATVTDPFLAGVPSPRGEVPLCATRGGNLLLLPAAGSVVARWLAGGPDMVRVSLPAGPPFAALRLTGTAQPLPGTGDDGVAACTVVIDAVEFTGPGLARVPVEDYRAAAPDPLWRMAPGILHHLEHGHMAELVRCVHAHGMTKAEWVLPRGLDRYGLELTVLTTEGIAAVRLSFPDGPVASLEDVPMSLRTALTCRCQADEPGHGQGTCEGRR